MMGKKVFYLAVFLIVPVASLAQINVYLGGNLQGNYSWIRGDEPNLKPGYGAGVSLVYWEHEYWFLKSGLDYSRRSSSILDYPDDYGIAPVDENDRIHITYTEQTFGIPLTLYLRPLERGTSTLLITGSLNTMVVAGMKLNSDEYGKYPLEGTEIKTRVKASLGIGAGYQYQLEKNIFLNIFPSFNIDLKGDKTYNSITLTTELIFGVY